MERIVETAREEARAAVEAAQTSPASAPSERAPGRLAKPSAKLSLVVALVAAIILLTILLPSSASGSKYTDVRQITAAPASFDGKSVAVVGGVQSGSVSYGAAVAFNLTDYNDATVWMRVVYSGELAGNFEQGKQVLVEGQVHVQGGVAKLFATKISVGCPTDYHGASNSPP